MYVYATCTCSTGQLKFRWKFPYCEFKRFLVSLLLIRMIFLGETFSGFVTVHNDAQDMVKEVSLKVCN